MGDKEPFFTVRLPDIGEGVVEGEVIEWLKAVGEPISQDEPVVVVMTDKATVELPSPEPGHLHEQSVAAGQIAQVGKPLYVIALLSEPAVEARAEVTKSVKRKKVVEGEKRPEELKRKEEVLESAKTVGALKKEKKKPLRTLPRTRRLAKELDIDLTTLSGSGPKGLIEPIDIAQSCRKPHIPAPLQLPDDQLHPFVGIRRQMARNMQAALTVPTFSYFEQVEVEQLIKMRKKFQKEGEKESVVVSFVPFFLRALTLSLQQFPEINSSLDLKKDQLRLHQAHNIALAMHTERGLIVPVLKGIEKMGLPELIRAYAELMQKARDGELTARDMQQATISLSNFGALRGSGLFATPILLPPQVAILALSKMELAPVVVNRKSLVRNVIRLSWSFDHRVVDGQMAVAFSALFARYLHTPLTLL